MKHMNESLKKMELREKARVVVVAHLSGTED